MGFFYRLQWILLFPSFAIANITNHLSFNHSMLQVEGVYEIELTCPIESLGLASCREMEPVDRLVILNTGTPNGVLAQFFSKIKTERGVGRWRSYLFTQLTADPQSNFILTGNSSWDAIGVEDKVDIT